MHNCTFAPPLRYQKRRRTRDWWIARSRWRVRWPGSRCIPGSRSERAYLSVFTWWDTCCGRLPWFGRFCGSIAFFLHSRSEGISVQEHIDALGSFNVCGNCAHICVKGDLVFALRVGLEFYYITVFIFDLKLIGICYRQDQSFSV